MKRYAKVIARQMPSTLLRVMLICSRNSTYRHIRSRLRVDAGPSTIGCYRDLKCIFVHIPKTGGISIKKALLGDTGGTHLPISMYKAALDPSLFNECFKFTFVRNPWSRIYSAFRYLRKGGLNEYDKTVAKKFLGQYDDFAHFIKGWLTKRNSYRIVHFLPQSEFVLLRRDMLAVDFVGKFENIEKDFSLVSARLGIEASLERLNKTLSSSKEYIGQYDNESKRIVAEVYEQDIRLFGYKFDS
ncbi:MAG: hypothetical protein GF344_12760 [Chitinivibrionales bacterium]|nr:hypothetical protein [Chitinivibrionales bacterium]MBD3357614.1 hypothetical protein [Chitinivibrionales bacterium]